MGMVVGHIFISWAEFGGDDSLLIVGTLFAAAPFGAIWPLMVIIASELFGSEYLSQNYMIFDGCSGCFGSILIGDLLTSSVYEAAHKNAHGNCIGGQCFGVMHYVIMGLCCLGFTTSLALSII